jgi:fatty acid desaturase
MLSKASCYLTGNVWQGISVLWWKDRHNKHHANSNTLGQDPDIDSLPVFLWDESDRATFAARFGGSVPWWAAYQHLYFLPVVSLLQVVWNAASIGFVLRPRQNPSKVLRGAYKYELATLLLHHAWTLYVAFALTQSILAAVAFVVVSRMVGGICIAAVVFFSHYSCEHFQAKDERDWARMQIGSTRNCRPSRWMDWFSGGINYQIERVVRGQDPVRRRLRRQVRQPVTKPASSTKYPTVPEHYRCDADAAHHPTNHHKCDAGEYGLCQGKGHV